MLSIQNWLTEHEIMAYTYKYWNTVNKRYGTNVSDRILDCMKALLMFDNDISMDVATIIGEYRIQLDVAEYLMEGILIIDNNMIYTLVWDTIHIPHCSLGSAGLKGVSVVDRTDDMYGAVDKVRHGYWYLLCDEFYKDHGMIDTKDEDTEEDNDICQSPIISNTIDDSDI